MLLLLLNRFSRVRLCATPETTAHQAPVSMDFPGKSTGVGCHCLLRLNMLGHNKLLPISHILMSKSHYHYIPLSCLPLDLLQTEVPGEFEIHPHVLGQGSPIIHSSCEGELGVALESLQGKDSG